jgi:hypothetical protein
MPRQASLVCQYLESISREALQKFQDIVREYTRGRQGVYALYRRGKLYYVGLASNLRGRLAQHLKDRHQASWDRFSVYLTVGDSHLRELESLLLRIVRPTGNKQIGKFNRKCQNLRQQFSRDIRLRQRSELDWLLGPTDGRVRGARHQTKVRTRGRKPVLAEYIQGAIDLRARFKGRFVRARVRRDGRIRFGGRLFTSPSLAGAAACGTRTCNGWQFWSYERAPGDWVRLKELRR